MKIKICKKEVKICQIVQDAVQKQLKKSIQTLTNAMNVVT